MSRDKRITYAPSDPAVVGPLRPEGCCPTWFAELPISGEGYDVRLATDPLGVVSDIALAFLQRIPALTGEKDMPQLVEKLIRIPGYARTQYKVHRIRKKSGGERVIEAPSPLLKKIQRAILDAYLYPFWRVSQSAMGFVPGRGIVTNAAQHFSAAYRNRQVVLKMDMHNFFPSISMVNILNSMHDRMRYKAHRVVLPIPPIPGWVSIPPNAKMRNVIFWGEVHTEAVLNNRVLWDILLRLMYGLVKVCCLDERLPQGGPTSPMLSNLVMAPIDNTLRVVLGRALKGGWQYTRYADDTIVSCTSVKNAVIARTLIRKIINSTPFLQINEEKTQILCNHLPQRITGVNINDKVSVSRWKRDSIRAEIHNLLDRKHVLQPRQWARISGYRAFMRGVDEAGWDTRCEAAYQTLKEKIQTGEIKEVS